jgi:hypothetical protein
MSHAMTTAFCRYRLSRLEIDYCLPPDLPSAPIAPGLFKADYGPHGTEMIRLGYDIGYDIGYGTYGIFAGFKITGDPNIPAEQITFRGNLNGGITLVNEDQVNNDYHLYQLTN